MYDCVVVVLLYSREEDQQVRNKRKKKKPNLDEGTYDAEGGETKVFKRTRFGSRIQERIKKKRYMRFVRRQ